MDERVSGEREVTIKISFDNMDQIGRQFKNTTTRFGERAILAAQAAAQKAAADLITEGKSDMAGSGNFSSDRWQNGLQALVSFQSRSDINIRFTHKVPFWRVFEFGATIQGKPLLWIPLSFAEDAQGVRARDYSGDLFRVDRGGRAPLLMASMGKGQPAQAKYFGKESVTIPQKFHLRNVARSVASRLSSYYKDAFKNG